MQAQVLKWGNSLAVRLPTAVVEALNLKEGDEIEISIAGKRNFKLARDRSKTRALEQLRQMKWSFPPDFKFESASGRVRRPVREKFDPPEIAPARSVWPPHARHNSPDRALRPLPDRRANLLAESSCL